MRYAPTPPIVTSISSQPYGRGIVRFVSTSTVFTVPAGVYKIRAHCIGAGGSGAAVKFDYATSHVDHARGGGGGGYAVKEIDVSPGDTFTLTIPVITAAVTLNTTATTSNGNAGGTTSFGSIFSATGGLGGRYGLSSVPPSTFLGGSGVGGDLNFNGGDGGLITFSTSAGVVATGGGAAGTTYGEGGSGVSVSSSTQTTSLLYGTGGGGVGAYSPVVAITNTTTTGAVAGQGAGATFLNSLARFVFATTGALFTSSSLSAPSPIRLDGQGAFNTVGAGQGGGGGGIGSLDWSAVASYQVQAGIFGGGGGVAISDPTAGRTVTAGNSAIGGGGGAVALFNDSSTATSGQGGQGFIIIEY